MHNMNQYKGVAPSENCLAWEASEFVSDKIGTNSQNLPHLIRILKDMQKTLDKTRVAYNQALQERDDERAKLQEAENRLGSVQRVVQRYAGVQEPVVASDGFTYERSVIQQYLTECKSTDSNAYSQQTKEVLTNNLVPNESLKKLVDLLRQVRPTDIAPASKATSIPPYKANVNFHEEEEKAAAPAAPAAPAKRAVHASELEAGLGNKAESTAPTAAPARRDDGKNREERPAPSKGGKSTALHPCLRVYGQCNFKDECSFARYPYDACLNFIKGKCRFGDGCKELHVNLKENKYINPNATNGQGHHGHHGHHGHRHADPHTGPKRSEAPPAKEDKKEVAKPAAKEATAAKTAKK